MKLSPASRVCEFPRLFLPHTTRATNSNLAGSPIPLTPPGMTVVTSATRRPRRPFRISCLQGRTMRHSTASITPVWVRTAALTNHSGWIRMVLTTRSGFITGILEARITAPHHTCTVPIRLSLRGGRSVGDEEGMTELLLCLAW